MRRKVSKALSIQPSPTKADRKLSSDSNENRPETKIVGKAKITMIKDI
jgi:hypothetical protein